MRARREKQQSKRKTVSNSKQGNMVNRPPASFFYERPPFRAAAAAHSADVSVAARQLWAASGLSSGRFAVCCRWQCDLPCI